MELVTELSRPEPLQGSESQDYPCAASHDGGMRRIENSPLQCPMSRLSGRWSAVIESNRPR